VSRAVVIVDTSVLVSGLLSSGKASPVARVLEGMLQAAWPFVVSEALLAEYHAVLIRAGLRKLHGLTVSEVETLLAALIEHAIVLPPGKAAAAPDPGDQLLWDLLAARPDLVLVTGDKRLIQASGMKGRVISPAAFLSGN
jgi:uncharacterized protein